MFDPAADVDRSAKHREVCCLHLEQKVRPWKRGLPEIFKVSATSFTSISSSVANSAALGSRSYSCSRLLYRFPDLI